MIKRLLLVFMTGFVISAFGQEGTSSPYSFYGIGSLKFKGTVENRSMGGLSIFADSIHVNLRNPASFAGNNLDITPFNGESRPVTFTVGGDYTSTNLETSDQSDKAKTTTFDYLALSFPVGRFGVGFGLLPYTSVGYKLDATEVINDESVTTNRYRGSGGLNKVFVAVGYQVTDNLSIGLDAAYDFGTIENSSIDFVRDDEGELLQYQSKETNKSELSGLNLDFGIRYTPMISENLQLTTAATYTPKAELTSRNERLFETIVINFDTGQEGTVNSIEADLEGEGLKETTLNLPSSTSFGVGIGRPRSWFLGAEYTFLQTSQFSNRIFELENATFENASTFAVGGFFIPQYTSFNKYWKRIVYRAGFRFENTGLNINGESIDEFGMSFGVGLPVGRLFSNANLGVEFGRRGTTAQNLVEENFFILNVSLSLNDRWFVKRKFN